MMKTTGPVIAATLLASSAHAALTISTDATNNVSCSAGVCSATAADAVLNVADLGGMLAASALTVQSGSIAGDIVFAAPFSWTASNALTLDSFRSLKISKLVSDAGPGALALMTNDGGADGDLSFPGKGSISFMSASNSLTINGHAYVLVKNVATLSDAVLHNPSGYFAFSRNYNASKDGTYGASPIAITFNGTFEGLGNTISNLSIDSERGRTPVGLFANTGSASVVKSIRLANINYVSRLHKAGATGGLAGENVGYLFDDRVDGVISSKLSAGGLTGANGLSGVIANSSANVQVKAPQAGGLAGMNGGVIGKSYASGKVDGGGGLVGTNEVGAIIQSYATGKVSGGEFAAGGLVSLNAEDGTIAESYSIGKIIAKPGQLFGGFLGEVDSANFSNNYWNTETSGTDQGTDDGNIDGVTGLTTKQFKSGLPAGFDPSVWSQDKRINNGYPYLIDNPPPK